MNTEYIDQLLNNQAAKGLVKHTGVFTDNELHEFESEIHKIIQLGKDGKLVNNNITYNKTQARVQINFGYYYSYGFDREAAILKKASKNKECFTRENSKGVQPVQMEKNIYGKEVAIPVEPMPKWMNDMIDRLVVEGVITEEEKYNSALINVYPKGGSIYPHVDDFPSFTTNVATVRIQNPVVMSFGYTGSNSRGSAKPQYKTTPFDIELEIGSIVIMRGVSGTKTTHGIFRESTVQPTISITFRQIKPQYLPNVELGYTDIQEPEEIHDEDDPQLSIDFED